MGIRIEKKNKTRVLHIEGDATIAMAEELKNQVAQGLLESESLTISLEKVADIDISCIQLVCSANRSFENHNKKLRVKTGKNSEQIKKFLIEAGYDTSGGCPEGACKQCLWKGDSR
ncbi:MAG: STAS domain-containing protein [Proteobacteria bacterium]|nr:STAS domain-containing protein [Pseudomonadota bacterium]